MQIQDEQIELHHKRVDGEFQEVGLVLAAQPLSLTLEAVEFARDGLKDRVEAGFSQEQDRRAQQQRQIVSQARAQGTVWILIRLPSRLVLVGQLMRSASRFDHTGTLQDYKLIQSRVETLSTNINQLKRQKLIDLQAQLEMVG